MSNEISGRYLRLLADRASDAGQEQLSMRLHDLAREQEEKEQRATLRAA